MPLKIDISRVIPPSLEFGSPGAFSDPKVGLLRAGPFDLRFGSAHKAQLRIGLIGTSEGIQKARSWLNRCRYEIANSGPETLLRRAFPGFQKAFHCDLLLNDRWNAEIKHETLMNHLVRSERERFQLV